MAFKTKSRRTPSTSGLHALHHPMKGGQHAPPAYPPLAGNGKKKRVPPRAFAGSAKRGVYQRPCRAISASRQAWVIGSRSR
jgi:hypothetical protein